MRGVLATTIGALAVTATAAGSNTTCAGSLYILCARGSGELAVAPKAGTYPDNTGSPGILALQVASRIEGTVIAGVIYPATDPTATGALNITSYELSENAGAKAIVEEVNQYHSACPDSKIALIGYSQVRAAFRDSILSVQNTDHVGCRAHKWSKMPSVAVLAATLTMTRHYHLI